MIPVKGWQKAPRCVETQAARSKAGDGQWGDAPQGGHFPQGVLKE